MRMALTSRDCIILDASCAINLYATGRLREIAATLDHRLFVADYVLEREILYVRAPSADVYGEDLEPVNLSPLIDDELIQVMRLERLDEQATFVQLASLIYDGEAMTGALALHRGCSVAIDDRKARRAFARHIPSVSLLSTLELLRMWDEAAAPSNVELREAMVRMRFGASYIPGRRDPLYDWWDEIVTG